MFSESLKIVASLMPAVKSAAELIQAFRGEPAAPEEDDGLAKALDIISAVGPLADALLSGQDVTLEDARAALEGADDAIAELEAELERRQQEG